MVHFGECFGLLMLTLVAVGQYGMRISTKAHNIALLAKEEV
jgi:hypothetical protein